MKPFRLAIVVVLFASLILSSCSKQNDNGKICKAELCTEIAYICKDDKQVSMTVLGGSISGSRLEVDVEREVDGNISTTPVNVEPGSGTVTLAEVKGVSGHPVIVRIKVKLDPNSQPLEVRSAVLEEGEDCPQDA